MAHVNIGATIGAVAGAYVLFAVLDALAVLVKNDGAVCMAIVHPAKNGVKSDR